VDSTQNIISLCTGFGGLELGIRRAGVDIRTICNVEIEAYVQALLVEKIEKGWMDNAAIYSDLKTFPASIFRGKVCGVIGGYPCQPFSSAGKRQGEEDPRHLWPHIRRHIRAIGDVRWCFFENVLGHTSMGLWRVLSDLEEEGFRCVWGVFSAEEVGAPHQRKRVFILAISKDRWRKPSEWQGWKDFERRGENSRKDLDKGRKEMGDTTGKRSCGGSENESGLQSKMLGERLESVKFPSRPNEQQYEWEEPRTIKSRLGRAINGTNYRNDRLRLLGNGVCPQTAELAWKTLWKEINK